MQDYPSVQPTAAVRLDLEGPIFAMLEDWRRAQSKIPSRSKAVRLLLALALSARQDGPRGRQPHREGHRTISNRPIDQDRPLRRSS